MPEWRGILSPCKAKIAGILAAFQDFLMQQDGKRPVPPAFNACEYRFYFFHCTHPQYIRPATADGEKALPEKSTA
jgi:hypothetical protein